MATRRDALKAGASFAAVTAFGELHPAIAQSAGQAWLYSTSGGPGVFRQDGAKQWVETAATGVRLTFEEAARTSEHVELHDSSRGLWLRLHDRFAEFRREQENTWHRLYDGHWVQPDKVPPLPDYLVRLAYFVPRDRQPTGQFEKKIRVLMHFVAEFYHQDLKGRGIPIKELAFETRGGESVVHLIRGAKPAAYYTGGPPKYDGNQNAKIAAEIPASVGVPQKHLIVVFAETYDDGPSSINWPGHFAVTTWDLPRLKTGGLPMMSAWILRDEFSATSVPAQLKLMFDTTPIMGRTANGAKPDSPRHLFVEDGIGAVAHELGHALGLGHDCRPQSPRDIMCGGYKNRLRWDFADPPQLEKGATFSEDNARILLSSRYLAADLDVTDERRPEVKIRVISAKLDQRPAAVTVAVDASDDRGLRAIAFHASHLGSVVGGRWLKDKRQSFTQELSFEPPKPNEVVTIEATVIDVGGNFAQESAKIGARTP